MTDARSKPAWTRCPKCKWRVFNDPIDKSTHDQRCPADLEKDLDDLARRIVKLEAGVTQLDEQVSAEPALDLDDIADWDGTDPGNDDVEGEGVDDPAPVAAIPSASSYYGDEVDDVDYGSSSVVR